MLVEVNGKVKLFKHFTKNDGAVKPNFQGAYGGLAKPTITYVVEKSGTYYKIKPNNFEEILLPLISDCQNVQGKLKNKEYSFLELNKLFTDYNSCL